MKAAETYWVRLYLSGPIEVAKQILREECARQGLCATIEPTHFVYTGGEEAGYVVGLINYPRFPSIPADIKDRAFLIARMLLDKTHQASCSVMTPTDTYFIVSDRIKK